MKTLYILAAILLHISICRGETQADRLGRIESVIHSPPMVKVPPIPEDLSKRRAGTIEVYITGQVNRSGKYYLREGADTLDAFEAALGICRIGWWRLTTIKRQSPDGGIVTIRFQRDDKIGDSMIKLQDGDRIHVPDLE